MFNKKIISIDNLINNIKQVRKYNQNSLVCAMVKADAYGVGADIVVQTIDEYVDWYGVACFFEAKKVRGLTNKPILIVGPIDEIDESYSYTCSSLEDIERLISLDRVVNIHIKVNSGMNRYGFKEISEFRRALKLVKRSKLILEGIYTHFATTDDLIDKQMERFKKFINLCHRYQFNPIIHADNSAVNMYKNHQLDMVRIGYNLYNQDDKTFSSVTQIRSKIVQINDIKRGELVGYNRRFVAKKRMKIAVIPIGYADGFDLRYIGFKLNIRGEECEVLNVCMDCFMLDISRSDMKKGDDIYILDNINSLHRYSEYAGISEYQVMTNFSHIRAERLISSSQCEYEQ